METIQGLGFRPRTVDSATQNGHSTTAATDAGYCNWIPFGLPIGCVHVMFV